MTAARKQIEQAEHTDRRIVRSRQMLVDALARLLQHRDFDEISILNITNEADLTRGTFYLHFPDKTALLQAMTAARFGDLLKKRAISTVSNVSELRVFAEVLCDYLARVLDCQGSSAIPLERAVIPVIEGLFPEAPQKTKSTSIHDYDAFRTAMAWAIYGVASRWARTPNRPPARATAEEISLLLAPMMKLANHAKNG